MGDGIKTCFFIGHRDAPNELLTALIAEVERHVTEYGVEEFVVGHYGNFDALAGKAVREVKARHPGILLTRLLPYHPGERPMKLPDYFDGSFFPPLEGVPRRLAIVRANRYMVLCEASHNTIYEKQMVMQSNRIKVAYNNLFCTDDFTLP